jgi:hypothetical protein
MHDYARLYENIPDYAISMAYYAILVAYSAGMPYLWQIPPDTAANESINNFLLMNTSSARTFSVWFDVLYVPGVYSNE